MRQNDKNRACTMHELYTPRKYNYLLRFKFSNITIYCRCNFYDRHNLQLYRVHKILKKPVYQLFNSVFRPFRILVIGWQEILFVKALSHGEIFLPTCNAILLLGDVKFASMMVPPQFANILLTYQRFVTNSIS